MKIVQIRELFYLLNVEKFIENESLFVQSLSKYFQKKIVYQAKKFGIQSLFVVIWFKIDQIVCDRPNIAVTLIGENPKMI